MTRRKRKKLAELKEMPNVLQNPGQMRGRWHKSYFENNNPITLELGCGKGEYTVSLARRYYAENFIGIDVKGARLWKGAGIAFKEGLRNAAFIRILIEDVTNYFSPGEVSGIWVTFPDPYPKPSKANKRLISPRFLNLYRQILKPAGYIHFKTDNAELFDYALDTLKEEKCEVVECTKDLYDSDLLDELTGIPTYYEEKFRSDGIPIKYVRFRFRAP